MRGVEFSIFPHWSMVHYGKIISKRFVQCKFSVQWGPSIFPRNGIRCFPLSRGTSGCAALTFLFSRTVKGATYLREGATFGHEGATFCD